MSPDARSALMSRIRGRNTKPELAVRSLLHKMGFRFRLHDRSLPGCPDVVFGRRKSVIFVHGCFWHRHNCGKAYLPKTRRAFWRKKFLGNVTRDKRNLLKLKAEGWKTMVIWECEIRHSSHLVKRLLRFLGGRAS